MGRGRVSNGIDANATLLTSSRSLVIFAFYFFFPILKETFDGKLDEGRIDDSKEERWRVKTERSFFVRNDRERRG